MKYNLAILSLTLLLFSCASEPKTDTSANDDTSPEAKRIGVTERTVNFSAMDGTILFGDFHEIDKTSPIIILFHQARGSARGEYGTIIPRLTENGYNVLAVDQRSGGDYFGEPNRTVAKLIDKEYGYCDAYPDLEAALNIVSTAGFTGKKFIWGSSYSAGLVIQLGVRRAADVDGVLAFSPASGEAMKDCDPQPYIESIKTPLIIFRPRKEMESESVAAQFESAKKHGHKTFIAEGGVHGSSMLVKSRTQTDVEKTWSAVFSFLDEVAKG